MAPLAATLMLVFLLRETRLISFPLPQNARLVPQFVTRVPFWGALQFGAEMGSGMRTYSPTGLPHVMVVAVFLLGGWSEAVLVAAGFAAGRALMVVTFLLARDKQQADHAFDSLLPRVQWVLVALFVPLALALPGLDLTALVRCAVGALLGAAVVGKLRNLSAFTRSLAPLGLGGRLASPATAVVLAVEVLALALVFSPASPGLVGWVLGALGLIFTAVQTYLLVGGHPECACFGAPSTAMGAARRLGGPARALVVLLGGVTLLVAAGGL